MALSHSNPSLILSSILIFSTSLFFLCHATDTLFQDQSLRDGQTLVSAGGIFEFGFFSPGKSKNRYVGIWHHNTSTTSYVWVANRENPVMDSSGSITVNGTGNLVLTDGKGNVVWSSNTSSTEATSNYTMQLLDLGNLVLEAGDGTVTWESFDHPTDTFLPGMQIKLDANNNISTTLFTSWKSPDDPSPGNYTLGLDPTGSAQIFIWESGSKKWWRSGQFNGQNFVGIIYRPLYVYGFKLTNDFVNQGVMFYTYSPYNDTTQRFVLQPDGVENCSVLNKDTRDWRTVWEQPVNDCEKYNYCGMNAKCSSDTATTKCSCLQGFEPKSIGNWSAGNWSGGCVRRTQLGCQNNLTGDGFATLKGVKLADSSTWNSVVGDEQACEKNCLSNCSCSAYTYDSTMGCLQWEHDLIDIYQFADGQYDMFIKLPASELGSKSKVWITIVVVPSVVVFFLATCCFLWWKYRKQIKDFLQKGGKQELTFSGSRSQIESKVDFSGPSQYGEEGDEGSELPLFTLDSIATATDNFSDSNKLGQGGFGYVYKGMLPGGDEIAVKRLSRSSGQGIDEFKNEIILIAKLQHRNLVRLIGCCIQGEEKILIYEYLPNKSLDAFLFDPTKQALLDWSTRFNIIEGISRGLLYLHRDSRLRIVHRDLKASNILLDEEMNPKISDFGMAKIFGGNQNQGNTNRVVGTYGYMSPEYAMEGLFSVKSDVYSFGILILEIITGKRNSSFHRIEECPSIIGYAYQLWKEDKAEELIDPSMRTSCPIQQAVRCVHIALLCVQDRANERPDIPYVILMLGSLSSVLPTPKPPTFKFHGSSDGTDKVESFSTYDVTITMLHGR